MLCVMRNIFLKIVMVFYGYNNKITLRDAVYFLENVSTSPLSSFFLLI